MGGERKKEKRTLQGPQRGPDPGRLPQLPLGIPKTQKFYQASAGHEILQERGCFEYIL